MTFIPESVQREAAADDEVWPYAIGVRASWPETFDHLYALRDRPEEQWVLVLTPPLEKFGSELVPIRPLAVVLRLTRAEYDQYAQTQHYRVWPLGPGWLYAAEARYSLRPNEGIGRFLSKIVQGSEYDREVGWKCGAFADKADQALIDWLNPDEDGTRQLTGDGRPSVARARGGFHPIAPLDGSDPADKGPGYWTEPNIYLKGLPEDQWPEHLRNGGLI